MSLKSARFLPPHNLPLVDAQGRMTMEWYKFFIGLHEIAGGDGKAEVSAEALPNTVISSAEVISGFVLQAQDAGTDVTVSITAGTRSIAGRTVTVNPGFVLGLAYNKTYVIYYRDPNREGGTVRYLASQSSTAVSNDTTNIIVGSVTTPLAGAATVTQDPVVPHWQVNVPFGETP